MHVAIRDSCYLYEITYRPEAGQITQILRYAEENYPKSMTFDQLPVFVKRRFLQSICKQLKIKSPVVIRLPD